MGASILTATRRLPDAVLWNRKRKTCWRRPRRQLRRRRSQTRRARRKARRSPKKRSRRRESQRKSRNRRKRKVNREVRNDNHENRYARPGDGNGLWGVGGDELRADGGFAGLCDHTREDLHVGGCAD